MACADGPAAVGVHGEAHVGADRRAHGADAGHVAFRLDADLDLHGAEALLDGPGGDGGGFVRFLPGDGELGGDEVAHGAAEQAVDRQADRFAEEVPEGHLQPGFGEGIARDALGDHAGQALDVPGVLADEQRGEVGVDQVGGGDLILAAPDRGAGDLAEADQALVGMQLDEQEGRDGVRAAPALDGAGGVDGDLDGDGLDAGDLH